MVHALKYGGRLALAESFGEEVAARVFGASIDAIVPMPLFPSLGCANGDSIRRSRSLDMSRGGIGVPLEPQLVERVRDTVPQTDLPQAERAGNMRGAFACEELSPG